MRTEQEYYKVIELKNQGKNSYQIAKITNIPRATVRNWIKTKPKRHNEYSKPTWIKEDFIKAVENSYSIANVLRLLNLRVAGANYKMVKEKIKEYNLNTSHWLGQSYLKGKSHNWQSKIPIEQMLIKNSKQQTSTIKKRIIKEKIMSYICIECKNTGKWNNKFLSLHLDHINGINSDNKIENLRFLCPNCHSQTATYADKNKGKLYKEQI